MLIQYSRTMPTAIQAHNISKVYQLGEFSTGTLSRDIERMWHKIRGKDDPFLKIGETNDRTSKGNSNFVWSLRDIDFTIEQGDAVGIIGRNGAGKSTLLKVLSRVTTPTTGTIKIKGRIASLLEVGTGFHPELTGRENIFLNGAILGMRKFEIRRKFDEIVDFAGVERYVDTPVKRYSSGMYVRLAFAVAAYLESEILVVDEVLAVGDAEFQKKCIGKMGEVSKGEGRTVLFVSHNMSSVKALCNSGILLKNGTISDVGAIDKVIGTYNNSVDIQNAFRYEAKLSKSEKPFVESVSVKNDNGEMEDGYFRSDRPLELGIKIGNFGFQKNMVITLLVRNSRGENMIHSTDEVALETFGTGNRSAFIPAHLLGEDDYYVTVAVGTRFGELYEKAEDVLKIPVRYTGAIAEKNLRWSGALSPDIVAWRGGA